MSVERRELVINFLYSLQTDFYALAWLMDIELQRSWRIAHGGFPRAKFENEVPQGLLEKLAEADPHHFFIRNDNRATPFTDVETALTYIATYNVKGGKRITLDGTKAQDYIDNGYRFSDDQERKPKSKAIIAATQYKALADEFEVERIKQVTVFLIAIARSVPPRDLIELYNAVHSEEEEPRLGDELTDRIRQWDSEYEYIGADGSLEVGVREVAKIILLSREMTNGKDQGGIYLINDLNELDLEKKPKKYEMSL